MSTAPEILNLGTICRCCHADGYFKDLRVSHKNNGEEEVYSELLQTTLGIRIAPPMIEASYTICEECIHQLRNAARFKKQVLLCEEKFAEYCKNELTSRSLNENCFKTDASSDNGEDGTMDWDEKDKICEIENKCVSIEIKLEKCEDWCNTNVKMENERAHSNDKIHAKEIKTELVEESKEDTTKKKTQKNTNPPEFDASLIVLIKTKSGTQYFCKSCGGNYASLQSLKRHIVKEHSIKHKCNECTKSFYTVNGLRNHAKTHKQNICSHCSKKFKSRYALLAHFNSLTKTSSFICDYCSKEFHIKSSLRVHIKGHLGKKKVCVCYLCGLTFNDITNMTIHIKTVHEKLRPFNCHLCSKTFTAKKHLVVHIRKHTGEKPFQCAKCSKWYYTLWDSKNHRCGDPSYRCKVCAKEFSRRSGFAQHVRRSHNGEKPHKCSVCGKDFTCKYSMRRHELTHSGIKPYGCNFCPMLFSQKAMVDRHVSRQHSAPKKVNNIPKNHERCQICKRVVLDLKKHNSKCHDDRQFACDLCPKNYAQVAALNRHKRVTHMGIIYKCDYCSKTYQQKNKLVKHQLKAHNTVKSELDFEEAANQTQ